MPWSRVSVVIDAKMQRRCLDKYPGHKNGCPNYGRKAGCPPGVELIDSVLDVSDRVFAVWNAFDIGTHADRMWSLHPEWSERQAFCCLYWQRGARKKLRAELLKFLQSQILPRPRRIIDCPEAMGVDVTATMRSAGVELEWPPRKIAYQVYLVGVPK